MIPVVFTHRGGQEYVRTAIEQARRRNQRVILVGDEANAHFEVEHYLNDDYFGGAQMFAKFYQHMSRNHYEQELYCFQIYFVARDLCRLLGFDKIFLMDSDVMLYVDVTEYEKTLGDYDLAISWCERQEPYRWSACLHNSFWKLPVLVEMCEFIMETYQDGPLMPKLEEKWRWHQENGVPGGVCDMTLLHFFRQGREAVNLSEVRHGSTWDDNINQAENYLPDEYMMKNGRKVVAMLDYSDGPTYPYLLRALGPQLIRVNALHFQGGAKRLMEEYRG